VHSKVATHVIWIMLARIPQRRCKLCCLVAERINCDFRRHYLKHDRACHDNSTTHAGLAVQTLREQESATEDVKPAGIIRKKKSRQTRGRPQSSAQWQGTMTRQAALMKVCAHAAL
jgi:hypothetical protein